MKKLLPITCALSLLLGASGARADSFAAGSLIIPMDTTYQDTGMLRAYGLVYDLLRNDVPVRWVIKQGKTFQGVDFTASAVDHQSNASIVAHGYRGGPWVIDSANAAAALPIINAWQANYPVTKVHQATTAFSGDVARLLVVAPKVAMHADGNQAIARSYLMAAGIPDSTLDPTWPNTSPDMLDPAEVAGPTTSNHRDGALFDADGDPVYCQLMSMHWAVTSAVANPEVVAEVRQFLSFPVHLFAECQAVDAFENLVPYGFFLTPNGFLVKSQPNSIDNYNFDSTFAQYDGVFGTVGGSEPAYALPAGDAYKAGGVTMITGHNAAPGSYDLWMTGYVDGACPPNVDVCGSFGKVSYLGGHQYTTTLPMSTNPKTQGTRLFLNSLFDSTCASATGQPIISVTKSAPATTTSAQVTFTLGYVNVGPTVALNAILTDPLPVGAGFVSATSGGVFAAGKVTWNLGNLGQNESGTVSVTVALNALGTYANTASLAYHVGLNAFTMSSNTTSTLYDKDTDGDGVLDSIDICPGTFNPAQDLSSDILSCGVCGVACSVVNGTPACVSGECVIAGCDSGFSNCDGAYPTGCEYSNGSFASDPSNCGGCGAVCAPANATGVCQGGLCGLGACNPGFSNCNGTTADGCEYTSGNFASDPQNCGGCGTKCAAGFVCSGGACVVSTCPPGLSDCDGLAGDGCEYTNTSFATDLQNCGGCGIVCAPAHATGVCSGGVCGIGMCNPGFSNCNGLPGDGCEYTDANFATDTTHCGGCGTICAPANALGTCTGGMCGIANCAPGFSNCNGQSGDGCEYPVQGFATDTANCGGCGMICAPANAVGVCTGGACNVAGCASGFVDLDQQPGNGCEYACTPVSGADTTCDGVDDDCDGTADEDYVPSTCGVGACAAPTSCAQGTVVCSPGSPSVEGPAGNLTCSDGVDNDCDGTTDAVDPGCQVAGCQSSADCDDGDPCTDDTCSAGFCSHAGNACGTSAGVGGSGGASSTGVGSAASTGVGGAAASTGVGGAAASTGAGGAAASTGVGAASSTGVGAASSTGVGGAGGSVSGGSSVSSSGEASSSGGGDGSGGVPAFGDKGSCACRAGATDSTPPPLGLLAAAGLLVGLTRRRTRSGRRSARASLGYRRASLTREQ